MSGINLNELPLSLQQKLKPYANIAKSVEDAIAMAKQNGKWTAADEKAYVAFNGNRAWGVFDGFEKTEAAKFADDFAAANKENPVTAMKVATKKGINRDAYQNPDKYRARQFDRASGRYIVYQKDSNTGKDSYKFYDKDGTRMTERAFKDAEGILEVKYVTGNEERLATRKASTDDKKYIASQTGKLMIREHTGLGVQNAGIIFAACAKDEETVYNFYNENNNKVNITFDNASLLSAMSEANSILQKIANNTNLTNEELEALKKQLAEINKNIVTIITNQQNFAKSADDYFKQIMGVINGNQELLKYIVTQLADSNDLLKEIRDLLKQNNATDVQILEAITKCKYGIDTLHQDNQQIKDLLAQIKAVIAALPSELQSRFSGYFNSIITGIADNGSKLDALINLLKVVNESVQNGHTAILNKMEKMQAVLDALFAKFTDFDARTTNLLNAIATALANITEKVGNVDLDKIERTLSAILDKIGSNGDQMEKLAKLLEKINNNTILNGQIQLDILDAINALDCHMIAEFEKLVDIGNKNNKLQGTTNELIKEVLAAIKNFKIEPGSPVEIDLKAVIDAINANGADLSSKLSDIYSLLKTINGNIVKGNEQNQNMMAKILAAIKDLDSDCVAGFNLVIEAIGKKSSQGVDLSRIEATLDAILDAIKNHKVEIKVTVDGHFTLQNNGCTDEGVIDNLDWLLG